LADQDEQCFYWERSFFSPNPLKHLLIYHKLFRTDILSEDILGNSRF